MYKLMRQELLIIPYNGKTFNGDTLHGDDQKSTPVRPSRHGGGGFFVPAGSASGGPPAV